MDTGKCKYNELLIFFFYKKYLYTDSITLPFKFSNRHQTKASYTSIQDFQGSKKYNFNLQLTTQFEKRVAQTFCKHANQQYPLSYLFT